MSEIAIRVEGLGKQYRIGRHERLTTLRDKLSDAMRWPVRAAQALLQRNGNSRAVPAETIWALKDVSFEVKRGEVLGIIGRNGAGKSTLLKILSRITDPTEGCVEIGGRIGSLLEVGTGFHPELTGRENVFLNGAILGMKKTEIRRRFDEIVAFAEIEKFLDTAVKFYSSGMYMRLAFAVAAHLEPEILLVDEVLAVGDAAFQKKCLGKMGDEAHRGRTVLFVSHNIGAIKRLCGRALWLDAGSLCKHGRTGVVVREYLSQNLEESAERVWVGDNRPGDDRVRLCRVRICQPPSVPCAHIDITQPFDIEIETEVLCQIPEIDVSFMVSDAEGTTLFHSADLFCGKSEGVPGRRISRCTLPPFTFNSGTYLLTVASDIPMGDRLMFFEEAVLQWEVESVCPTMGRYRAEAWKGCIGPGLGIWNVATVTPTGILDGKRD